jgi:hypothetical protein
MIIMMIRHGIQVMILSLALVCHMIQGSRSRATLQLQVQLELDAMCFKLPSLSGKPMLSASRSSTAGRSKLKEYNGQAAMRRELPQRLPAAASK